MPVISVDNCGEIGLIRDAYPQEMQPQAWSDAQNFLFREGYAQKAPGHIPVYGTPSIPPYHLTNFLSASGNQWVYAGLEKAFVVDSNFFHTDITRAAGDYTGGESDKWNGGVLSGIVILNNGVDNPQFYAGSGVMADLTNWPANTKCKIIRPFRNHLIAMNVTEGANNYPHLFKWSHSADPGTVPVTWDVTDTTKLAGAYDLADDQTELVDGLSLGEQFIAYKRSGYYAVQYIGAPFVFRFQKISGMYGGALAVNCVTEFPSGHFVLGPGDVYVHQVSGPESVIDARNRKWLYRQLDGDNRDRAFTMAVPLSNELWVCFPQSTDEYCTLALVWNWKYNTWGVRELPGVMHGTPGAVDFTGGLLWSSATDTWESADYSWSQNISLKSSMNAVLASPVDTKMYVTEVGAQFDTTPYNSYVERKNVRFDKPNTVKLLKQVRPLIEGPVGSSIDIYVNTSYDQTADSQVYGPYPFVIGVDQKIDCHVQGRMLGVKFMSSGTFPWRVKRYDLVIDEIGLY